VSTVIQLTYEDRIIPSSLSSVWITTIDPFSARHHAFWWEDESASSADGRNGVPKTVARAMLQKYQMYGKVENTKEMDYSEYAAPLKTPR